MFHHFFEYPEKNGRTSCSESGKRQGTMEEATKVCPTALIQGMWPGWPLPVPSRMGLGRPGARFQGSRLPADGDGEDGSNMGKMNDFGGRFGGWMISS